MKPEECQPKKNHVIVKTNTETEFKPNFSLAKVFALSSTVQLLYGYEMQR